MAENMLLNFVDGEWKRSQAGESLGVTNPATADVIAHLALFAESAIGHDELVSRLQEERAAGKRIVVTNGCFDVLHRGHTAYLNQAKRLGDVLVVAINSDDSVRRLKGPTRPINPALDRSSVLAALSCVDYVTVFDTDTPIPLLERIRPDVYAKGGDYEEVRVPVRDGVKLVTRIWKPAEAGRYPVVLMRGYGAGFYGNRQV